MASVTRLIYYFYQYLAIYNNGHLPNSMIICPSRSKILPSTKLTLQKLPKPLNFQPKWRNFAKSCHTARPVYLLSTPFNLLSAVSVYRIKLLFLFQLNIRCKNKSIKRCQGRPVFKRFLTPLPPILVTVIGSPLTHASMRLPLQSHSTV